MPRPFRRGGGGRGRPRPGGSRGRSNNRRGPFTPNGGEQSGNGVAVAQRSVELPPIMTVEELATLLSLPPAAIISGLIKNGIFATMNQVIDYDTASSVAADLGFEAAEQTVPSAGDADDEVAEELTAEEQAQLVARPAVVTVMGHVDHGKTSLLDRIRSTRVAVGEAGGITQHIGAYQVEVEVDGEPRKITFLDTPGHEAFTAMRARGAQATDIAVLVVAADDGVMPQTAEAIDHARAARVPIVVALNKMDRDDINPDRVKQQLAEKDVVAEEYGGDVPVVPVSARTGDGIDELLTNIALMADIAELKADPTRTAAGLVVEAKLDKSRGPVATVLVQRGTLNAGDVVVIGPVTGKIRALVDDKGKRIKSAGPSMPAEVLGLNGVPKAGDRLVVVPDEKTARQQAALYQRAAERNASAAGDVSLEDIYTRMKEGEVRDLNLVVKADVQGSIEPLVTSLQRLQEEGLRVKVIGSGTGSVTESDVMLASASKAIIIAFNVRVEPGARAAAETQHVDLRHYTVIYNVIEDVRKALVGLLGPRFREIVHGHAEIRQVFPVRKGGAAAGCLVVDGQILSNDSARVKRSDRVIWDGKIASLRRIKEEVREVSAGTECGILLDGFSDFRETDVIESYGQQEVTAI
ncbi:MAG TPA: translation initiation factor IF-2 [Chloroflexota bacterium]|nr:translation initiation factor IF-2 [Chloroflexota bacterium]